MTLQELGPVQTAAQATNISTATTLNARRGQITTQGADAAAAAENEFTFTNSFIGVHSVVVTSFTYGGAGTPIVQAGKMAAGSCTITITNVHSADALNAALVINFVVLS